MGAESMPGAATRASAFDGHGHVEETGRATRLELALDGLVEVGARPGASVAVQRGTPVTADVLRSSPPVDLEPIFEPEGSTTAAGFAPAADGVTVLVLSTRGSRPLGELLDVRIGAGDPIDPLAGIGVATGLSVDGWSVAEPSASTVLLVLEALGLEESAVNADGGTIAVSYYFAGRIDMYDVETGTVRHAHGAAHPISICAIAFNDDGTGMVTAADDGSIKVWRDFVNLQSDEHVTLMGHA